MKHSRLTIVFIFASVICSAQLNLKETVQELCPCFQLDNDQEIRTCILGNEALDNRELETFLDTVSKIKDFLFEMSANCDDFRTYMARDWPNNDSISDDESSRRIYQALSYFRIISSTTYPAKQVEVTDNEMGLVLNTFRSRLESGELLEPGYYTIDWHDSLITYSTKVQSAAVEVECLTDENRSVTYDASIFYKLNKATIPLLYNNLGTNYEKLFIEPRLRKLISSYCNEQKYLEDELSLLRQFDDSISIEYFIFEELTIEEREKK